MPQSDSAGGQHARALRDALSRLSAAVLRVSASLDVATVLREAVDAARALTGAGCGVVATVDEAGRPQEFICSGLSADEERRMSAWPDAMRLFDHLRGLDAPLRLPDLGDYVRGLGLAPGLIPCSTFCATPLRHGGIDMGSFFLGEKAHGAPFDADDEALLALFAAQAAIAVANARAHRDERRARADLEALVETAPVGVVVFDAATAAPLGVNREARRIVDALRLPGRPAEELLGVLTSRLADGRAASLDDLRRAVALRGEEVELSVPDGRSLRVLVNVTPIRDAAGAVERVVATVQDLAPLEEQHRQRDEFLAMVGHGLRAPLTSIKGSTTTLLGGERPLDAAELRQFHRIIDLQADHMTRLVGDLLDAGRIDAGTLSVDPQPVEVAALVERGRAAFLTGAARRPLRIDLPPGLPRVVADAARVAQVLHNLFANAARYSPPSAPIHVAAARDGVDVAVSVTDEGPGLPEERLPTLFRRYADAVGSDADGAGSGLGLAICKGIVEAHGGRIRAANAGPGLGARFTFTLPAAPEGAGAAHGASLDAAHAAEPNPEPVLVVDDDPETLRYVRRALAAAGYATLATGDPDEAAALVRSAGPRLVLLDLVLPGTDGLELLESVFLPAGLPVIFISAYGGDEHVARALERGAADYIVKPFSATELTARVRAALRGRNEPEPFVLGDLTIDYGRRRVAVSGRPVRLTPTEFQLLRVLSLNAGRVVTHASLLRQVWPDGGGDPGSVRDFARRLRRKLGDDPRRPAYVANERGVGYRMPRPDDG